MRPPPLDLAARRPLWIALSEFWLDTEMSASTAHYVVRILLDAPYSLDEAEAIHWREVAPVLYHNLYPFSVAGEWGAFPEDWLVAACERQSRARWPAPLVAMRTRALRSFASDLPDVVFERARRAQREGLPPRPTGPFQSLVASRDPVRYRVPW